MMKTTPTVLIILSGLATAHAQDAPDREKKHRQPAPIPRSMTKHDAPDRDADNPERGLLEVRSIDGSGNNNIYYCQT